MSEPHATEPRLDAPGAGLPRLQGLFLRHLLFPILRRCLSWNCAVRLFEREGARMSALVDPLSSDALHRRVLVPSLLGIEDSSRHWSAAMTLDHVVIVSSGVRDIIILLSHGRTVPLVVDTAKVKPQAAQGDVVATYRELLTGFRTALEARVQDRKSASCHPHPWFGCLTPHGWMVMLVLHQFVHRRQLARICEALSCANPAGDASASMPENIVEGERHS